MGKFTASLRMPGDSRALAATLELHDGRLQVASGDHVIGDWELGSIDISRIPEGIRVAAEGEVLLLDIPDQKAFEEEAAAVNGHPKRSTRGGTKTDRPAKVKAVKTPPTPKPAKEKRAKTPGDSRLDQFLARMKERFGTSVPNWVFTRTGVFAAIGVLALCIVFAKQVSYLLLIAGVIALLTGGVTMLDSVIARRVLRHRVTPIQVVIGGGSVFVLGLLVGVVGDKLWG